MIKKSTFLLKGEGGHEGGQIMKNHEGGQAKK